NPAVKPEKLKEQELQVKLAELRHVALKAVVRAEMLREMTTNATPATRDAAKASETQSRRDDLFVVGKPTGSSSSVRSDLTELQSAWTNAAFEATSAQRDLAVLEAESKLHQAQTAKRDAQGKADEAAAKTNGVEKATRELEAAKKKSDEAEKA